MSHSVRVEPSNPRCKYWAKIVRSETPLPAPQSVTSANDVPGPFLQIGVDELGEGDFLFEGEANHAYKKRGWTYLVTWVRNNELHALVMTPKTAEAQKDLMRPHVNETFLMGSGMLAACVRWALWERRVAAVQPTDRTVREDSRTG